MPLECQQVVLSAEISGRLKSGRLWIAARFKQMEFSVVALHAYIEVEEQWT